MLYSSTAPMRTGRRCSVSDMNLVKRKLSNANVKELIQTRQKSDNSIAGAKPISRKRLHRASCVLPQDMDAAELAKHLSAQLEQEPQLSWEDRIFSHQFLFGFLWLAWLFTGTIAYANILDINWAKAFYMAVNVGYSVGWGDISETGNASSQWFSIFFLLCGSSFVAAALGFFGQSIVTDQDNWYTNELQRIAHEKYSKENKNNYALLVTGWLVFNFEKVRAIVLWFAFIVISTAFAWATNDWCFREALYFSLSSLSTGGLYPLPEDSVDWHYGLAGFYTALGVPLMAVAMATLASFFITTNGGDIERTFDQVREPVTDEELELLTDFELADDDDIIDKAEFIILCMVRIGAASPMLIKKIVEFYNELDVDGEGVDADEMSTTMKESIKKNPSISSIQGGVVGSIKEALSFSRKSFSASVSDLPVIKSQYTIVTIEEDSMAMEEGRGSSKQLGDVADIVHEASTANLSSRCLLDSAIEAVVTPSHDDVENYSDGAKDELIDISNNLLKKSLSSSPRSTESEQGIECFSTSPQENFPSKSFERREISIKSALPFVGDSILTKSVVKVTPTQVRTFECKVNDNENSTPNVEDSLFLEDAG